MNQEFYIDEEDWDKIQQYARAAYNTKKSEIGGILIAEEDSDGDWLLKDPVIVKQEISGGNCVLDKEALACYYTKVGSEMQGKSFRFVWWHSHHTMAAFWSQTDLNTIEEEKNSDFSFALVINLKEEYKFRVSVWRPFEVHTDVELNIVRPAEVEVSKAILEEVAAKCSTIKHSYVSHWDKAKGKSSQLSLINQQEYVYGNDEADYQYAHKMVDKMLTRYCDGTMTYEGWVQATKQANKNLSTKYNSIYKIELVTEGVLQAKSMMTNPNDFIVMDDAKLLEEEEYLDMVAWNESYGVKAS